jgi:hypothetical protein
MAAESTIREATVKLTRIALALAALALAAGARTASAQQAAQARTPPRMLHPAAGKEQCLTCHGPGVNAHIKSTPAAHQFGNEACAMCHRPIETAPPRAGHAFGAAFTNCRMCHVANSPAGAKAPPASHAEFHVSICATCHQPAQGS